MHYRIEGMDCASCVGKVETALARMPGVSDIQLNFATERLELTLAPDSVTQAADIEKVIKDLGFGVTAVRPMGSETLMDDSSSAPRWWQTRNGKQVVALGILMGSAYGAALLVPSYGAWVFALAALGALVIGEAQEAAAVVFLFSVGELLESVAAGRARAGSSEERRGGRRWR